MTDSHHAECLLHVPIFNFLDEPVVQLIASKMTTAEYAKHSYIYQAGDRTDSLFIVSSGAIRTYRMLQNGKEQLLRVLRPGDFVGEWTIFHPNSVHEDYAEVIRDTTICVLRQADLQAILIQYPEVAVRILQELSTRLSSSERQTLHVATEHVVVRLALYLADLVEDQTAETAQVTLPFNRKELASYLGTSPETVSRKFKELEDAGLIRQSSNRVIQLLDLEGLVTYEP